MDTQQELPIHGQNQSLFPDASMVCFCCGVPLLPPSSLSLLLPAQIRGTGGRAGEATWLTSQSLGATCLLVAFGLLPPTRRPHSLIRLSGEKLAPPKS